MFTIVSLALRTLLRDRRGVTAVEYTVIAALVIGAVAGAFTTLANDMKTELTTIAGLL